jgi:hypothetical protein
MAALQCYLGKQIKSPQLLTGYDIEPLTMAKVVVTTCSLDCFTSYGHVRADFTGHIALVD